MDAYVYMQVAPGKVPSVLTQLAGRAGLRKALAVVGNWDVLVQIEGPDLDQIAATVLSQLHGVDGVIRTLTTPVVPADRVGVAGFGNVQAPPIVAGACYVHVQAQAGAAAGLVERVSEMQDVAGVAVLGGDWDLLICIAQPWEVAALTKAALDVRGGLEDKARERIPACAATLEEHEHLIRTIGEIDRDTRRGSVRALHTSKAGVLGIDVIELVHDRVELSYPRRRARIELGFS